MEGMRENAFRRSLRFTRLSDACEARITTKQPNGFDPDALEQTVKDNLTLPTKTMNRLVRAFRAAQQHMAVEGPVMFVSSEMPAKIIRVEVPDESSGVFTEIDIDTFDRNTKTVNACAKHEWKLMGVTSVVVCTALLFLAHY